jgi:hypothetical protein
LRLFVLSIRRQFSRVAHVLIATSDRTEMH